MKKLKLKIIGICIVTLLSLTATAAIPNGNFETGTCTNWTRTGTAWNDSPDTTAYWPEQQVGYGCEGTYFGLSRRSPYTAPDSESATGTLCSSSFTFTTNQVLSFLICGWSYAPPSTTSIYNHVSIKKVSDNTQIGEKIYAPGQNTFLNIIVTNSTGIDQEVYIEVTDNADGGSYAWLGVDDFKLINLNDPNFDFEAGYLNWNVAGSAWGTAPVTTNWMPVHFANNPIHKNYYANSMVGGESATGTLRSATFTYPQDGYVKFLVGGHSTYWEPAIYNYVVLKDADTHAEYGRVYAPDQNDVEERSITNSSAFNKEVYVEIVDNCDEAAGFAWIAVDFFQAKTPVPEPPQGVYATKGSTNDRIIISWYSDSEADKYIVYRNTSDDTNSVENISGVLGDVTQFDDETALDNIDYYYWVKAGNSYGWSELSDYNIGFRTDSTGPNKPENISPVDGVEAAFPISLAASAYSDSWTFIESQWQISSESDFSSPRKTYNPGAVTNISPPNGDFYNGTNYWRVKYKNNKNKWSDWSDTTFLIINRNLDSPFYFYETFNNVSGSGNVNKENNVSGRQLGFIAPLNYVLQGTTEVGNSAANPNKLTLSGSSASCSPDFSFENYSNFKIEFDIEPSASGTAFSFGKEAKNAAPNSDGGMSFVFFGNGNYDVYSSTSKLGSFNNSAVNKSSFHIMIKVSTLDFDNSTGQIAMFADGQPLVLLSKEFAQAFHTNHYNYVYEKASGFKYNNVTFYNFAGISVFDNFEIQMANSDNIYVYKWTDDTSSRINSDFNYTHAVNFNTENNFDINSVTFTGTGTSPVYGLNVVTQAGGAVVYQRFVASGTESVTGDTWELIAADGLFETDSDWEAPPYYVAPQGDKLLEHFIFSSEDGIQIKLNNLTPGTSNIFAMHFRGWWGADFNYQIAANDKNAPGLAPVELYGAGTGTVFEYLYKVPENGKLNFTLSNCGLPMYSFSNFELTNEILPKLESLDLIDFGEVAAGQTKTFKLPVFNFGAGTVSGIVTGADAQFELLSGSNYSAKSESPDFINISFSPEFEEQYSNTIFLTGSGGSLQIELKGIGVPEGGIVFSILYSVFSIFIFRRDARTCV